MKTFYAIVLTLLTLGLLSGCGGGGSSSTPAASITPAASTLSGIAAVGFPIANGAVQIKCASGGTITTITDINGAYTATLAGQTLPCAVEVSGGTRNNVTNTTKYHSIATATGTVNVTPLTDLMVANLAAGDPSNWFTGLNGSSFTAITTTSVNAALTNLRAALTGLPPLATINPITTNFTAISGNVSDDMLSALGTATGGGYATLLVGAAGSPSAFTSAAATLNTALPAAYAGTTSGSLPTVASFTPSSGVVGITVTITGTNFSATPASNTVRFNGVLASVNTASTTQLVVTVPAAATSGKITVLVSGQTAMSTTNFTVTAAGTGTNAALVGTWKLMSITDNATTAVTDTSSFNMIEVLAANGNWTFTQPTAAVGVTCQQSGTSTSTATTITTTTVSDPCSAISTVGKVETDTYTIAGSTLTTDNGTRTFTYQNQAVAAPAITSFTPSSGAVGVSVTLAGTNFSTTAASNIVSFNGVAASVSSATATQLVVTVPAAATTGAITVLVGVQTATSPTSFTVSASPTYVVQGGLTWMPVTFGDTWTNANTYCTNTTINGLTGWRQPTQAELSALYTSGAMNGQGWTLNWTWSSTPGNPGFHSAVGLAPGGGVNPFADTTTPIPVSCVHISVGGGGATTAYGSCTHVPTINVSACDAYIGSFFIDSATLGTPGVSNQQNSCLAPNIWAASSNCSTANRVGACRGNVGLSTEFQTTFYSPTTVSTAQTICASPGVWVP